VNDRRAAASVILILIGGHRLDGATACGRVARRGCAVRHNEVRLTLNTVLRRSQMLQTFDPARLHAFEKMLAGQRPLNLPPGGQVHRFDGDPDRRTTRLPRIMMAWLQHRHLEIDAEEPLTARARAYRRPRRAVRLTNPSLKLLRPTGTG
jgi:hypothetical protein